MGLDSGEYTLGNWGAGAPDPSVGFLAGKGSVFFIPTPVDVAEVGVIVTQTPTTVPLVLLFQRAPVIGGAYTTLATLTGPARSLPVGARLRRLVRVRALPGQMLQLIATVDGVGAGVYYVKAYPVGGVGTADDVLSST